MDSYLLFFGVVVLILFSIGVFYTVSEFNEMSNHPEDFHRENRDKIDIE